MSSVKGVKGTKPSVGDVVEVLWIDSCGQGGWTDEREVIDNRPCDIRTVGILIRDGGHYLSIVQSHDSAAKTVDNFITIPKVVIYSVRKLA